MYISKLHFWTIYYIVLTSLSAIGGKNYTTVSNTHLYLSYFDLSYVFPGHDDGVERGLTVLPSLDFKGD